MFVMTIRNFGSGYFVVTPETFRVPQAPSGEPNVTFNNWLQYQPMYIPVFPQQQIPLVPQQQIPIMPPQTVPIPPAAQMRSISCQAQPPESTIADRQSKAPKPRSRSQSVRGPKGKEKEKSLENDDFKRVMSVRCRPDKTKEITKDLKSTNLNSDKIRGEKVSLFSKIFGRNKKKIPTPAPTTTAEPVVEKEKEYATFSAQFPPPEWQWYQQQQEKHRRTEKWVTQQMVKSRTWHHMQNGAEPPNTRCNTLDGRISYQPMGQELTSGNIYSTLGRTAGAGQGDYMVIDGLIDPITGTFIDQGPYQKRPETGGQDKKSHRKSHHDDRRSHDTLDRKGRDNAVRKSQDCLDKLDQEPHGDRKRHGHRKHRSARHKKDRNNDHYDQDENVDPYGVYVDKDPPSPVLASDNYYQHLNTGPYHSTPRYYDTIPSRQPREEHQNCTESQKHGTHQRRTHRAHRKKSSHHRNTYYGHDTCNDTDISFEYHGKLPNKNSTYAQSCDSGVNCVGLKQEPQPSTTTKNNCKTKEFPVFAKPHPVKKQLDNLPEESKGDDGYVVMENPPRRVPCNDGYDSSIMETPANTMIVCQAEINHHPIPQIVLDTEPQQQSCFEPDVAQSSSSNNGSRNELSSTRDGSCETVVENVEAERGLPAGEDTQESKPESLQQEIFLKPSDKCPQSNNAYEIKASKVENATVEVKELSLKDSGFSSPRYAELVGGNCPKQPASYQRFQEHMAKPVLKVNNTVSNCCQNKDNVYENQTNCMRLHPTYDGRGPHHNPDKCQCHKPRSHENQQQIAMNNQRNIFRLKPENFVQSQWVDGPASDQQPVYSKQFRLSGEFEVVGVV